MRCKTCGEPIVIFSTWSGELFILGKPRYGEIEVHYCEANGEYDKILSKRQLKKLGLLEERE